MIILGFNGSVATVDDNRFAVHYDSMHDAGAVLLDNGKIVCAFEEEKLNRIKHSNKFPVLSIGACLRKYNIGIGQVDAFAFPGEEALYDLEIARYREMDPRFTFASAQAYLAGSLNRHFNGSIHPGKVFFINHHQAHAASSYYTSDFDRSLIFALDGSGDNFSGGIYEGEKNQISTLARLSANDSLGHFYVEITYLLGFKFFDEYKVMGLAPYGNKEKYRHVFNDLYCLQPAGKYTLYRDRLRAVSSRLPARKPHDPVTQDHKDIAAALQDALESIVLHVARHYRSATGHTSLCLCGGVALNCTMTGKLLYEGLFENIYVPPTASDVGLPLGAALHTYYQHHPHGNRYKQTHSYLGTAAPDDEDCRAEIMRWQAAVTCRQYEDIAAATARLIAGGNVVGWFQGASEFGPRALGNRSILADPRPAGNKDLINLKIKNREGFRPFAPSLVEEEVGRFFELPGQPGQYEFMTYTLYVKDEYRHQLGAVTHADGTARLQTVAQATNPRYYRLISHFGKLTGIPVLLNTSFNNHHEPIVDTPGQAMRCFLTTQLDYLVIGDYLVQKRENLSVAFFLSLHPLLPRFTRLHALPDDGTGQFEISNTFNENRQRISGNLYALLKACDGSQSFGQLIAAGHLPAGFAPGAITDEINELWTLRLIDVTPGNVPGTPEEAPAVLLPDVSGHPALYQPAV